VTVCIAALCDDRKAIILAADKMIGSESIESEADIHKIVGIHRNWWALMAADDISPAFPIIDHAKAKLHSKRSVSVDDVIDAVAGSYQQKRLEQAEAVYLIPRGWTLKQFQSAHTVGPIPDALRTELDFRISAHRLYVSLLVAGFDRSRVGHIFSVSDHDNRGDARRHDVPGYHAIGSGSHGACFMMAYRSLSSAMPIRAALYYVAEGKYFGEFAAGVGIRTDLYVVRPDKPRIVIKETAIDDKLMKLCDRLAPRPLRKNALTVLNSFHGKGMDTVPKIRIEKVGDELVLRD